MRGAIAALLLIAAAALAGGDKAKSEHPCFDDQGALRWYTDLNDAKAKAKREGKLVFIEMGRET